MDDNIYVCGGYAAYHEGLTNAYKDVDLYFATREKYNRVLNLLTNHPQIELFSQSPNAESFHYKDEVIQCVACTHGKLVDVLKSFDFNICRVGLIK